MMPESLLTALGLSKGATIGGFIGALISLRFFPALNIWQGATTLFSGWACAAYTTPLALKALDMTTTHEGGVGFLIGVLGMAVISNLLKALPDWVAAAKVKALGNDAKQTKEEPKP